MDYRWQLREFSTELLFLDLIFADKVLSIAEQLLGDNMIKPPVPHGKPMGHAGPAWPDGPVDPAQENMWRDWSKKVQESECVYSERLALEQRLPLGLQDVSPKAVNRSMRLLS